ncbi:MAG: hypothetical protein ACFFE8_15805 [Candidatus Heimdallarchaeota archaeon]
MGEPEKEKTSWSDHVRNFILAWYLWTGVVFVGVFFIIFIPAALVSWIGMWGLDVVLTQFPYLIVAIPFLLPYLLVFLAWPLFYLVMLDISLISVILQDLVLLNNPLSYIFYLLFLIIPVVGYLLTYFRYYTRIPRSKEDLILPLSKNLLLEKRLIQEEGENPTPILSKSSVIIGVVLLTVGFVDLNLALVGVILFVMVILTARIQEEKKEKKEKKEEGKGLVSVCRMKKKAKSIALKGGRASVPHVDLRIKAQTQNAAIAAQHFGSELTRSTAVKSRSPRLI